MAATKASAARNTRTKKKERKNIAAGDVYKRQGKGNIGYGVGKSGEVPEAIRKGEGAAKKNMHKVAMKGSTIPHEIVGEMCIRDRPWTVSARR